MPKQAQNSTASIQDAGDALDSLNARARGRGPQRLRRKIEATIEAKAKKRRGREAPASSGWKK